MEIPIETKWTWGDRLKDAAGMIVATACLGVFLWFWWCVFWFFV